MSETERSVNYAKKRSQALRNCESHLQTILFNVAKRIISVSAKYRTGGRLTDEASFLSEAKRIAATASDNIEYYTGAYAKASCRILGIGTDNIEGLLAGDVFGSSLGERNTVYLANFAEDIVRMVKAGTMMGYSDSRILSAVRTGYKNPYKASVVTKAQKKDISIATPSYGKGVFRNAYQNIVRNSKQVISIAWGSAENEYGVANGAIGYYVHRGSSFPCHECDSLVGYLHDIKTMVIPRHVNCVCRAEFVFKDNKTK